MGKSHHASAAGNGKTHIQELCLRQEQPELALSLSHGLDNVSTFEGDIEEDHGYGVTNISGE